MADDKPLVNSPDVNQEVPQLEIMWLLLKDYVHCLNLSVWNAYYEAQH